MFAAAFSNARVAPLLRAGQSLSECSFFPTLGPTSHKFVRFDLPLWKGALLEGQPAPVDETMSSTGFVALRGHCQSGGAYYKASSQFS